MVKFGEIHTDLGIYKSAVHPSAFESLPTFERVSASKIPLANNLWRMSQGVSVGVIFWKSRRQETPSVCENSLWIKGTFGPVHEQGSACWQTATCRLLFIKYPISRPQLMRQISDVPSNVTHYKNVNTIRLQYTNGTCGFKRFTLALGFRCLLRGFLSPLETPAW